MIRENTVASEPTPDEHLENDSGLVHALECLVTTVLLYGHARYPAPLHRALHEAPFPQPYQHRTELPCLVD